MSETCETVKVKTPVSADNPSGYVVINKSDLTADHELFECPEALAAKGEKKPSDGLTVEKIKEALAAKGIEIPEGVTLKADLAALLDAAA